MATKRSGVKIQLTGEFDPRAFDQASSRLEALRRQAVKNSDSIGGAFVRAGDKITGAGEKMKRAGAKMTSAGKSLTMGVTVPVVAMGALAVNAAAKFETSMNQVGAATDTSGAGLKKMSDLAMKMGAETMFSAQQAADAMLELAKAGMAPAQIEAGGLKAALDLAAAGGIDLADAATITSNAMNMFGLKAKDAGAVADALAGGANASSASVDSLRQALSQVGPGAKNSGLSLQQTVGVLAAFADKGIQGSDAGTSLKTMLQRLIPQTDKAAQAMKDLGLKFTNSKGEFDDISTVAQKLKDKLGPLSEAERARALQTMFGSDATRAATVLMNEGADGLAKYMKATNDKSAADRMAEARTKGAAGAIERMKGSVETAAISIGGVLAPYVVKIAKLVENMANKFAGMSEPMKRVVIVVGLIAAAAGPLLMVVGSITSGIGALTSGAGSLVAALGAGGGAAGAGGGVAAALGSVASVALPVIAVLAALAAGAYIVWKNWDKFKAMLIQLGAAFAPAFKAISTTVKQTIAEIAPVFKQLAAEVIPTVQHIVNKIIAFWKIVGPVVTPLLQALVRFVGGILKALAHVIRAVMAAMRGDWKGAWNALKEAGITIIKTIVRSIKDQFNAIVPAMVKIGRSIVDGLKRGLSNAWSSVTSWLSDKISGLSSAAKKLLGINSPSKVFAAIGASIPEGMALGIKNGAGAVTRSIANLSGASAATGGQLAFAGGGGSSSRTVNLRLTIEAPGASPQTVSGLQAAGDDIIAAITRELRLS